MVNLSQVPVGRTVRIRAVGGEPGFRRRLMELGFLPGALVTVLGAAPLRDPLHLELRGGRFSVRHAEASAIFVSVEPVEQRLGVAVPALAEQR